MAYTRLSLVEILCLMAALVRSANCTSLFSVKVIFVITRDRMPLLHSPLGYDSHQHDAGSRMVAPFFWNTASATKPTHSKPRSWLSRQLH